MKKLIATSICLLVIFCVAQTAHAQKYLTFESKTFSVLLKCTADYTKVTDISFSENGAWVVYKIVKTLPLENKTATGNIYVVEDAKAAKYSVEYMYVKENAALKTASCTVLNHKTSIRTTLKKK